MSIKTLFQNIADAIKVKDTSIVSLTPSQMPNAILNIPSGGGIPENVAKYIDDYAIGGIEYYGYIYGNSTMIANLELSLLADTSQVTVNDVTLTDSLENYSAIILQGVYSRQRTSNYNTSMLYFPPKLNHQYWAGMKDRNSSYTCYVTFDTNTHANLTGNKQVLIYGMK